MVPSSRTKMKSVILSVFRTKPQKPDIALQSKKKLLDWFGNINPNAKIIWPSLYAKHVKRFLHFFPRDQLLIVDGDSLINNNPSIELRKIEQFLNVSNYFTTDKFVFSQEKGFYCFNATNNSQTCLGQSKGRKHEIVAEKTRTKLRDFFENHNHEFFQITGRHFDWK